MMHLIKAIDPADLLIQVNEQLALGRDVYTSPFVSDEGLICQRMVTSTHVYEYRLIIAKDLDDLYNQENNALEMGFDYIYSTVLWHTKYLQWMTRMNIGGWSVRDALARLSTEEAAALYENAERPDELKLVEDVRAGLHMVPTASEGYVVRVPFPLGS